MGIDFHFYMPSTYRSSRSAINCKQNTSKVLDRQIVETGEIRQNKLCNMQEIGQEIEPRYKSPPHRYFNGLWYGYCGDLYL